MLTRLPRRLALVTVATASVVLATGAPAMAAAPAAHVMLAPADIFSSIGQALLGAFSWTVNLASKFVLDTLGGLVRLLIPRSWASEGAQIMAWIVAVPNYAGRITSPGGGSSYGFVGVNSLRVLFMWLGMAVAPLTLTHAVARAMIDEAEPVAIPVLRILCVAAGILVYPYLWAQAANLADQVTHLIIGQPEVTSGLAKLMDYAVDGVALGGWQLIDLGLMGAIGVALLGLIFMKVVIILLGALLYATGPLMVGLVPTRLGHSIARAWLSAVLFLLGIGIGWAALFAVGAVLIQDASTAGPLLAGNSTFGHLIGGLILAVAGLAALWMCLKLAREAGGLLRMQLGGMLALGAGGLAPGAGHAPAPAMAGSTGASLRRFGARVSAAGSAAGGEVAAQLPGGTRVRHALGGAASIGRRGLIGTAAQSARGAGQRAAGPTAAILGRSRAGEVAVAIARRGTAAYTQAHSTPPTTHSRPNGGPPRASTPKPSGGGSRARANDTGRARRGRSVRAAGPRTSPRPNDAARAVDAGTRTPTARTPAGGRAASSDTTSRTRPGATPGSAPARSSSTPAPGRSPSSGGGHGSTPTNAPTPDPRHAPSATGPTRPAALRARTPKRPTPAAGRAAPPASTPRPPRSEPPGGDRPPGRDGR